MSRPKTMPNVSLMHYLQGQAGLKTRLYAGHHDRNASAIVEADLQVRLEIVLDPELNDARESCLGRDAAERARIEVQVRRDRIAPVEMIEEIERLQAELQPLRPGYRHDLRYGQVDVPEVRPG